MTILTQNRNIKILQIKTENCMVNRTSIISSWYKKTYMGVTRINQIMKNSEFLLNQLNLLTTLLTEQ